MKIDKATLSPFGKVAAFPVYFILFASFNKLTTVVIIFSIMRYTCRLAGIIFLSYP